MVLTRENLDRFQMLWKALRLSKFRQDKSLKLQRYLPLLSHYRLQRIVIALVEFLPLLSLEESSSGRSRRLENERPNTDKSLACTWNEF